MKRSLQDLANLVEITGTAATDCSDDCDSSTEKSAAWLPEPGQGWRIIIFGLRFPRQTPKLLSMITITTGPSAVRPVILLLALMMAFPGHILAQQSNRAISCLGRIEPAGGVVRLSGPTALGAVIMDMKVKEGDWVDKGQPIAILDSYPVSKAEYDALKVDLELAEANLRRERKLVRSQATSASKIETLELAVKAAEAKLAAAGATLNLSVVKAPRKAQVIAIHANPGERSGVDGIVEIGQTDTMYAVAEVYETDIALIKPGQTAIINSPALPRPVNGTVESVGLKVGRIDVLGMDPIAQADARVIEVDIRLEDTELVQGLTNLQVEVEIRP